MSKTALFLLFGAFVSLSCNPARVEDPDKCVPGQADCDPPVVPPKPKPNTGNSKLRIGPKAPIGFDTKQDGSYGVQTDKDGNVILDPAGKISTTTPVIWVANSQEGTVSKIDTRTMIEVARYYTYPGGGGDPSRTTVGLQGDVVVANRAGSGGNKASAVRIAGDRASCVDRNLNGVIDTSENAVFGQAATPIPWPSDKPNDPPDECILWMTPLTANSYPRAAGYNAGFAEGDTVIYIGLYSHKQVVRLDQRTGKILKTIDVSPSMPYGLVLDKNGDVWVRGADGSLGWIQVSKGDAVQTFNGSLAPPCGYGIAADAKGFIYTAGSTCVSRFDPIAKTWEKLDLRSQGASFLRGLAVDSKNQVWIADTSSGMFHVDASGPAMAYKGKTATLSSNNVGAAIDFDNNPWVISQTNGAAYKVDTTDYSTKMIKVGTGPYTYSDMTGYQLRNAAAPTGIWRYTAQGCGGSHRTKWVNLDWTATVAMGTEIVVKLRSGATKAELEAAPWKQVSKTPSDSPPVSLEIPEAKGILLQVEFSMRAATPELTPILSSVTFSYDCIYG
ncbi:MAG TPA: hypothetical protein PKE31_02710 [Pseudomonadota bacterium]|nr:hypothetical protein [Pseudomonadota bacterium]